jgi:hypothetical protein
LAYGQPKSYSTAKVAYWTLEKFPKHFLIRPFRIYTEKAKSGQLKFYQELNEYGKAEGLTVTIQKDYTSPHTVYYYRNGNVVYRATFFDRSSKADEIVNYNLNHIQDGPNLKREFDGENKLIETIEYYNEGELVREKKIEKVDFNSQGLLDGDFNFTNEKSYTPIEYDGVAKNGELLYLKENYIKVSVLETRIEGEHIIQSGDGRTNQFSILTKLKITNNKEYDGKEGFFYCKSIFDIPTVIDKMQQFTIPNIPDTTNFIDSLLEGKFSYFSKSENGFIIYSGHAHLGFLRTVTVSQYAFDKNTGSNISKVTNLDIGLDSLIISEVDYLGDYEERISKYKIVDNFKITNSELFASKNSNYCLLINLDIERIRNIKNSR